MKDSHLSVPGLSTPFLIGNVAIRNRVVLAPMSGITDLPFRQLAWRFGAGLVVTEMVASRELVGNRHESWARLKGAGLKPHMVQLAGRDPHYMGEAARIAADQGADIIDINMGCPARKVTSGDCGSALMREPEHALRIVAAVVAASPVPVTLKMRLGWDENSINAPFLAKRAEDAGISAVIVHGRTRMQFYEGRADWEAIRAVRDVLSVPLVANGDVDTPEDAADILHRSGADAVMVGRACQGRPWHAGALAGQAAPAAEAIPALAVEHYDAMLEFYGEAAGVRHARKHLGWYLDRARVAVSGDIRAAVMTSKHPAEVRALMTSALSAVPNDEAMKEAA
ncbi:tRNA dihydrouridine synthase DusB [Rhizobiaceae bacterium BDR2-2]|uniref:tRNA-dihydrouridine synthase n=1 Tax=Ectorhizobium quercum TaxID=2965071 RepID=A0AAE3N0B0_9HYPH|nr:tRNA dihydrouridine synthase DusB [Ectorhizobium quercum]MCX8997761.1 tRNA dihydrouridine synthase DusB [Ectorhizobium quercum]